MEQNVIKVPVKRGDYFCTADPQSRFLGKGINIFQRLHSKDNSSTYGHAGIITDAIGGTFEALMKIRRQNIYTDYAGKLILIVRPVKTMEGEKILDSMKDLYLRAIEEKYEGKRYPGWRLALHIFPPLAKYLHFIGLPVCSELAAMYLAKIGARYQNYWGVNPDTLADEARIWGNVEVIYEGNLLVPEGGEGDEKA